MKYIKWRKSNGYKRYPMVFVKTEKYGDVLSEEAISPKSKLVLIVGAADSGKSRYLKKFQELGNQAYVSQMKIGLKQKESFTPSPALFLRAIDSQGDWLNQIEDWYSSYVGVDVKEYRKLNFQKKVSMMKTYLDETRALLLLDDVDKLTAKKQQIVKELLTVAYRTVATCRNENQIPPSIRQSILSMCGQTVQLDSDVSYDITVVFMSIMTILLSFGISPVIGTILLLGGLGKLATGAGAVRLK